MKLILGSESEGRQLILNEMGLEFSTMPADIDESVITADNPHELTIKIAKAKADALIPQLEKEGLLITGDSVSVYKGEVRGKPKTGEQVTSFLNDYSNSSVENISATVITDLITGKQENGADIATVYFKEIPKEVIEDIVEENDMLKRAGGYAVQNALLKPYIERVEGDISTIIGLSRPLTEKLLEKFK